MKKLILALMLAGGTALAVAADKFADISTTELNQVIRQKQVTLLDVNGTESWRNGHIPGALDFLAVKDYLAKYLPADKNALIVAYCGNESCPAYRQGAAAAKKLGYRNIKHYAHGIQGWVKDGQPTEKAN